MSQSTDNLGHDDCFLVVVAEVVCSLSTSVCWLPFVACPVGLR